MATFEHQWAQKSINADELLELLQPIEPGAPLSRARDYMTWEVAPDRLLTITLSGGDLFELRLWRPSDQALLAQRRDVYAFDLPAAWHGLTSI